jgi:1-acyl-sn-glycerol-3-phosphate acyltransferase
LLARLFFRSVEVVGAGNLPRDGGGLLVAWHPNGLADGILVLGFCPRPVTFGARHGLFRIPLVGWLLRGVGAVPLYRARDSGDAGAPASDRERRAANHRSLVALAAAARRSFVAIFPEGATHDEPNLLELRAGAARLFQLVREGGGDPALVPVGLHYERKHRFRSRALVAFHAPVELPADLAGGPSADTFVERLTSVIEEQLIEVTHPTESWSIHRAMERVRSLVRAEAAARAGEMLRRAPMHERDQGFARVWAGYGIRRAVDPQGTARLVGRVRRYDEALRLLGLSDRELDGVPLARTALRLALLGVEALVMLLLLPTVVLVGNLINLPAALLVMLGAKKLSKTRKEQAGLKMLLGLVILPTAWVVASLAVGLAWTEPLPGFDWVPESLWVRVAGMLGLCFASALLGLRYHRLIPELAHGLRALWTLGLRTGTVERLRRRRRELYDEVIGLAADPDPA